MSIGGPSVGTLSAALGIAHRRASVVIPEGRLKLGNWDPVTPSDAHERLSTHPTLTAPRTARWSRQPFAASVTQDFTHFPHHAFPQASVESTPGLWISLIKLALSLDYIRRFNPLGSLRHSGRGEMFV